MTPECRQEMQYYKQLAVAVERRINDLRFCLDETTINSNILHSDSEEWCDGINISMVSSKNDYINESFSDCYKYDCLNSNYHIQSNNVENNEFESMNSQLTVIDNDEHLSEAKLSLLSQNKVNENSPNKTAKVLPVEQILDTSNDASQMNTPTPTNLLADFNSNPMKVSEDKEATKELFASKDINFNNNNSADHLKIAKNLNINIESTKSTNICENPKNDVSSSINISKPSPVSSKLRKNNSKKDIPAGSKSSDIKSNFSKTNVLNLKKMPKKTIIDNKNKLSPSKNVTGSLNNISSGLSSPPKLVRQNSYTLEYPSPLLLAHLEVQSLASGVEMHSISMSDSTSTSHLCNTKQKNLDSNTAKEVWSSLGSDINSLSLNECSAVVEKCRDISSVKEASVDLGCDEKIHSNSEKIDMKNVDQNSSKMSSIQNVKIIKISESVPHIESQAYNKNNSIVTSDEETSQPSLSLDTSNKSQNSNNSSLKFILKKFEEDHAKKLAELVKKQKEEQILLQKSYENQQKLLLAQFQSIRQKENQSVASYKSNSINESENNKSCDSKVLAEKKKETPNLNDLHKQAHISESVSSQSQHLYSQKTPTKTQGNMETAGNYTTPKSSHRVLNDKHFESQIVRSEECNKISNNPNKEKVSEYIKNKEDSTYETYDNMVTSRSANTLDDINVTFASDDSLSTPENNSNNTPLYSNVTVREIDGMSKLKSAFDKITRIQQNLASQSSFKYPADLMSHKTYYEDDCLSNKSQTVSLSSIGTISQICSEPEIHYSVLDRNALSLNLVDISRPQSSRHQNYLKHKRITEKEVFLI